LDITASPFRLPLTDVPGVNTTSPAFTAFALLPRTDARGGVCALTFACPFRCRLPAILRCYGPLPDISPGLKTRVPVAVVAAATLRGCTAQNTLRLLPGLRHRGSALRTFATTYLHGCQQTAALRPMLAYSDALPLTTAFLPLLRFSPFGWRFVHSTCGRPVLIGSSGGATALRYVPGRTHLWIPLVATSHPLHARPPASRSARPSIYGCILPALHISSL